MSSRVSVLSSHKRERRARTIKYFLRNAKFGDGREIRNGKIRVPFRCNPNGTLSWSELRVNRDRAQDPAFEMMGPAPDGVDSTIGSQLIQLINPLEKSADCTRVNLQVVFGESGNQAIAIACQGQKLSSDARVFRVEGCVRYNLSSARDGSPDRVPIRLGDPPRLTL